MNIINVLVQADEYHKYGHALPGLAYLLKVYNRIHPTGLRVDEQKVLARIDLNDSSHIYQATH